ncbi:MAG: SDR family NAD(P)-dependent oxidoreductase [Candidatus Eremiobacteraeota bacterium]|nr:SDR family NAD(P)-dependent oxidoreductase [Candidatus Eremiobacteraeota bacterium]
MSWFSRLLAPPLCSDPVPLRQSMQGKVVLLTGASFGIGAALAVRLQAAGARVLLAARSEMELKQLGEHVYPLDLRDPASVDEVAAAVLRDHGGVDVVIHNAGKSIRRSLLRALDRPHDFERCMGVNYLGPVRLQLALLPSMIARGSGHIVNVSSVGVRLPPVAQWAAYLASKSAFDHWLGAAVPELRRHGIRCTSVYLGLVHTRMSAPTKEYASLPGLSADEAACVLCRALIRRPRSLAPWWLEPLHWLGPILERPLEWFPF